MATQALVAAATAARRQFMARRTTRLTIGQPCQLCGDRWVELTLDRGGRRVVKSACYVNHHPVPKPGRRDSRWFRDKISNAMGMLLVGSLIWTAAYAMYLGAMYV
jgi:hypothetical protein